MYEYIVQSSTIFSYCNRARNSHGAMMDTVCTRLKALRNRAGLTVQALADELAIPKSSYAFYEDNKKYKKLYIPMPTARQIANVLEVYGVDREDVMALAGLEPEYTGDFGGEKALDMQAIADQLGLALVPEIDIAFAMGEGIIGEDYPQRGFRAFNHAWLRSRTQAPIERLAVVRGDGDSMQPTLLEDDDLLIDLDQNMVDRQDRIWAFAYGDLGMIKRVRRLPNSNFLIISDNQTVQPFEASTDELHVIGRVIWVGRKI